MSALSCDWSQVASNWDRLRAEIEETSRVATEAFLDAIDLKAGERVLELGGGNGELAARLAGLVRPGGSVLASDVAPEMVEVIRARTAGDDNVTVQLIDATDIALDTASFDVVVFRMGLMLVSDPSAALQEIRRVLRPGGRLAATVWGAPQHNAWMASVGMAAMMHGLVQGPGPNAASDEQLALMRQTVADLTAQYRDGDALELPARALVLIAS